jgi:predicted ATPase
MISKIRVKNFGPIKEGYTEEDGWLNIKKVTMFIGNQGSGKSTVAKLLSTLMWLEKACHRDDIKEESCADFLHFCKYQKINHYFRDNTEIEYIGNKYHIACNKEHPHLVFKDSTSGNSYAVPQIMYVPAERNLLTSTRNILDLKLPNGALLTFAEELLNAYREIEGAKVSLPVGHTTLQYNNNMVYISERDYKIELYEASSGYQSFVPLYLVTKFLIESLQEKESKLTIKQNVRRNTEITKIKNDATLSVTEKEAKIKEIDAKYLNTCLVNIVEEPEQNLFPSSQWEMLQSLLRFNNVFSDNKLILTTHSPYLISYLSIAIQGKYLESLINQSAKKEELLPELYKIIPEEALIDADDVAIYQLNEEDGSIEKLHTINGIPSDNNYLNNMLEDENSMFDALLEIEQKL